MPKRTWTDEGLRAVIASSRTWADVLRGLGLTPHGRSYDRVKRRVKELELDASHLVRTPMLDDARLREAASASTSFAMLLERLELPLDSLAQVKRRATTLGLETSTWSRPRSPPVRVRARRWTDDQLREAVSRSETLAGTLRALGLIPAGGNYAHVQRRIRELGVDTSHFTGRRWNVGLRFDPRRITPLEEVLVAGRWASSHSLKNRLFAAGLKTPRCELCGWAERAPDGRIPVELDHANGVRDDNRLENLRILCPNCHALQPTHRGLNQKRRKKR